MAANWWYSHGAPNSVVDIVAQAILYPYLWGLALLSPIVCSFLFLYFFLLTYLFEKDVGPQVPVEPATDPAFIPRGIPITFEIPDSGLVCNELLLALYVCRNVDDP